MKKSPLLFKQTTILITATLYTKCSPMARFQRTLDHHSITKPELKSGPSPNTKLVPVELPGELFLSRNTQQLWARGALIFNELAFQHVGLW